ncbi:DUF262 domain-containing protein [Bifidobacterium sp. CP2]|uniref:GmrSD restriction endonuclease domain-containing protein n=1 Tax=Bifidobacterium sp. CP2 TaxID=2809025 RepID=UPI001F0A758C|nr:DUF262 domain-containing protein [Bifidobacterium sp. CP2]
MKRLIRRPLLEARMSGTFKSNDVQVSEILRQIADGEVQLPDFQRGWVWDDYRIRSLIASIMNAYPVGALMFLEYGGDTVRFKYRPFTGSDADCAPEQLVLDGQQRLTSIFNALYCKTPVPTRNEKGQAIDRYYYLDIRKSLDVSVDKVDAIVAVPEDRKIRSDFGRTIDLDVSEPEKEYEHLLFPLNIVFDNMAWINWMNGCRSHYGYNPKLMQLLDEFQAQVLIAIQQYKVPVIQLAKETPKEAVCQVFENVNTGGVSLTVFELVTASFAADDYDLRGDWEGRGKNLGRRERMRRIERSLLGGVTATDFLTSLTLLTRYRAWVKKGTAVSCKKKDVLSISLDDYTSNADELEQAFIAASRFLNEQRVFTIRDLPYSSQLIPLSALFALLGSRAQDSTVKSKLTRWYWCGVLGEMYGGANETRYAADVTGVMAWLDGGNEPDTVARAYFQPTRLLTLQTRQSAAYKGIMALILRHGAVDFMTGQAMDFVNFTEQSVDIHHIFPAAYCQKMGYDRRQWNSIVNKTAITAHTNRVVGGTAPSSYMGKIERDGHVTREDLDRFLTTHLVDVDAMRQDDFRSYFVERAKALLGLISDAMGKTVTNRAGDDVLALFGASLE